MNTENTEKFKTGDYISLVAITRSGYSAGFSSDELRKKIIDIKNSCNSWSNIPCADVYEIIEMCEPS